MNKQFQILALLLFALIQCFAPLVHAHVDGNQCGTFIHSHDIPHYYSEAELSQSHIESYESRAISIPHEHHRDDTFAIPDVLSSSIHPFPPHPSRNRNTIESGYSHPSVAFAYQKPHTQAPPEIA